MTGTYIVGLLVLAVPVLSTVAYSALRARLGYPPPGSVWTGPDGHRWTVTDVNGRKVGLQLDDGKPYGAVVDINVWSDMIAHMRLKRTR